MKQGGESKGRGMPRGRMLYLPALLLAAVLLACAAALLALSEKAEATFPGKNGRIAYALVGSRGGGIYTIYPNGSGRTKITKGLGPSYSPDGKKLVYTDWDGNYHDIELYMINAGGGGKPQQITHNATDDYDPSWSPDGKKIAYEGSDRNGAPQIYTINAGGGGKFQVTHHHYRWRHVDSPSYSPSGKRIAYIGYDGNDSEVYTIDAGGGNKVQVTHNKAPEEGIDYSPDGKKIAVGTATMSAAARAMTT